jgi:alpha-D-ribose 1-methylphosphonate 5-triphosphate diphosphatase
MDKFGPDDRIGIVSLMDHTPGERQFRDFSKLWDYMGSKRGMTTAEFDDHIAQMRAIREQLGDRHETGAVAAARRYGATLASHDDTTAGQVTVSAGHGAHFAEFPTTVEAAKACHAHGIKVMMGAPNLIRGGSHSGNVAARDLALARLLDIVSSDYVPSSLLSSALMLGDLWGDMSRGIATVTAAPADAVGLTDRGHLVPGARADVIRVTRVGAAGAVRGVWSQVARAG